MFTGATSVKQSSQNTFEGWESPGDRQQSSFEFIKTSPQVQTKNIEISNDLMKKAIMITRRKNKIKEYQEKKQSSIGKLYRTKEYSFKLQSGALAKVTVPLRKFNDDLKELQLNCKGIQSCISGCISEE